MATALLEGLISIGDTMFSFWQIGDYLGFFIIREDGPFQEDTRGQIPRKNSVMQYLCGDITL